MKVIDNKCRGQVKIISTKTENENTSIITKCKNCGQSVKYDTNGNDPLYSTVSTFVCGYTYQENKNGKIFTGNNPISDTTYYNNLEKVTKVTNNLKKEKSEKELLNKIEKGGIAILSIDMDWSKENQANFGTLSVVDFESKKILKSVLMSHSVKSCVLLQNQWNLKLIRNM